MISEEDAKKLEDNRPKLMRCISLEGGLVLAELRAKEAITKEQDEIIRQAGGNTQQVGKLLDFLLRGDRDTLPKLIAALNATGHAHLVDDCFGEASVSAPSLTTDQVNPPGLSTDELQDALMENLRDKLQEWETVLEEVVSAKGDKLDYIDQPCTVMTEGSKRGSDVASIVQVVEESASGDHILIYGEAGMGKTALLKHLAHSWVEKSEKPKFAEKFKFVFLIPMRSVGCSSLLGIICDELKLIPKLCEHDLLKALKLHEKHVVFLLDSYEELRRDVARVKQTDVGDLIAGKLFPRSTVILTSRPGYKPGRSKRQKVVHLKNLPEDKVRQIIQQFDEDEDIISGALPILSSFPKLLFLQKPINLMLFLFIIGSDKQIRPPYTQARFFNLVIRYITLAFAEKKGLKPFIPQAATSVLANDIPNDIRRLLRDIAKKCYEERHGNNGVLSVGEDELEDFVGFGLFKPGPNINSVILPHPLFHDYLAAVHLVENQEARDALFEEIKERSDSESPRRALIHVLEPLGLDNIVGFIVALSPQFCEKIGSLFVLERVKRGVFCLIDLPSSTIRDFPNLLTAENQLREFLTLTMGSKQILGALISRGTELFQHAASLGTYMQHVKDILPLHGKTQIKPVNLNYYTKLLYDCSDVTGKRALATALLNASVRDVEWGDNNRTIEVLELLSHLNLDDGAVFLKNIYDFNLCETDGKTTKCISAFAGMLAFLYDCTVTADKLVITGATHVDLQPWRKIPANIFSCNIRHVRQLFLISCTFCKDIPALPGSDLPAISKASSLCPTSNAIETIHLCRVEGLTHCDVISSCPCQLYMHDCHDVSVHTLKTSFPKLSELKLTGENTIVYASEVELLSWLSTITMGLRKGDSQNALSFTSQNVGESLSLGHLLSALNILKEGKETQTPRCLLLSKCRLLLSMDVASESKHNNSIHEVKLKDCEGIVDLARLIETCIEHLHLKSLTFLKCQLQFNTIVKHNSTLCDLTLSDCKKDVDVGQLLDQLSHCFQLKKLVVEECRLVNIRNNSDTVKLRNPLIWLCISNCEGVVALDKLLLQDDTSKRCVQLGNLLVHKCKVYQNVSNVSMKNDTLTELVLSEIEEGVDFLHLLQFCSQCIQLSTVSAVHSQVNFVAREISETAQKNTKLENLHISCCRPEVSKFLPFYRAQLAELFRCQPLRARSSTSKTAETVPVTSVPSCCKDSFPTAAPGQSLYLIRCTIAPDLLDVCTWCQQLREVNVEGSTVVIREEDFGLANRLPRLYRLKLKRPIISTTSGRQLSKEEARQHFRRLFPSTEIIIMSKDGDLDSWTEDSFDLD